MMTDVMTQIPVSATPGLKFQHDAIAVTKRMKDTIHERGFVASHPAMLKRVVGMHMNDPLSSALGV